MMNAVVYACFAVATIKPVPVLTVDSWNIIPFSSSPSFSRTLQTPVVSFEQGRYSDAAREFERLLRARPDDAMTLHGWLASMDLIGKQSEVDRLLSVKPVSQRNKLARALYHRWKAQRALMEGNIQVAGKEKSAAIGAFGGVMKHHEEDFMLLVSKVEMMMPVKALEARALFEQHVPPSKRNADLEVFRARLYGWGVGPLRKPREKVTEANKHAPQFEVSLQILDRLVRKGSPPPWAYYFRGIALHYSDKPAMAQASFKQFLAVAPSSWRERLNAMAYLRSPKESSLFAMDVR